MAEKVIIIIKTYFFIYLDTNDGNPIKSNKKLATKKK